MATATLFVAVGKLGFQHAVIRFYAQINHGESEWTSRDFHSTVLVVFGVLSIVAMALWLFIGTFVLPEYIEDEGLPVLFAMASGTVLLRLFGSAFYNFLRASHRSAKVGAVQVVSRYLYIGLIVGLLFFSDIDPFRVLAATLVGEIVSFLISVYYYRDKLSFSFSKFQSPLAKTMLWYGVPLMVLESLGVILRLCDRYLIGGMLGEAELGMYSASYNLTGYLEIIVLATVAQAIRPVYMTLWERDGAERTAVGIPFVAVFSATAPHLLNFLASPKFAPGTVIIPFVTLSFMLDGALCFLGAGLYIKRNTRTLMFWGMVAAVSNLVLNILVIPLYGILGASIVTVISYLVFVVGVGVSSAKFLTFAIDWKTPIVISLMSLMVYFLLMELDFGSELLNLFAKGFIGCVFCLIGLLVIDKRVGEQLTQVMNTRFRSAA